MGVHRRSIESYHELLDEGTINDKQFKVAAALAEMGPASNREIARHLGWDINRVTGRMTELRYKGYVEEHSSKYDSETNRLVTTWKCT